MQDFTQKLAMMRLLSNRGQQQGQQQQGGAGAEAVRGSGAAASSAAAGTAPVLERPASRLPLLQRERVDGQEEAGEPEELEVLSLLGKVRPSRWLLVDSWRLATVGDWQLCGSC